jgi:hypothetical protein
MSKYRIDVYQIHGAFNDAIRNLMIGLECKACDYVAHPLLLGIPPVALHPNL